MDVIEKRNSDGRRERFAVSDGSDKSLVHQWESAPDAGDFNNWTNMGPTGVVALTVGTNSDGRLEVFYCFISDTPFQNTAHMWQDPAAGGWVGEQFKQGDSWNGGINIDPSYGLFVVNNADGRLELFGVSDGGKTPWHTYQDPNLGGGWPRWFSVLPGMHQAKVNAIVSVGLVGGYLQLKAEKLHSTDILVYQQTDNGWVLA